MHNAILEDARSDSMIRAYMERIEKPERGKTELQDHAKKVLAHRGLSETITQVINALLFKGLRHFSNQNCKMVGDLGIEPSVRLREGVTVPCHTLRPVAH